MEQLLEKLYNDESIFLRKHSFQWWEELANYLMQHPKHKYYDICAKYIKFWIIGQIDLIIAKYTPISQNRVNALERFYLIYC